MVIVREQENRHVIAEEMERRNVKLVTVKERFFAGLVEEITKLNVRSVQIFQQAEETEIRKEGRHLPLILL